MSNPQHSRDKGQLFENKDKRKQSQPDLRGNCAIDGAPYEMQAWRREERLSISLAPPRGDSNTYPPESFRGMLDPAKAGRGQDGPAPSWTGEVVGDDATYAIQAFEKQGKSGAYLALFFTAA